MARDTAISWADATWNVITGCSVISPGCQRCYAMKLAGGRLKNHPSREGLTTPGKNGPVWNGKTRFNSQWLYQPLHWRKPIGIFVCAHSDLFHESVPDEILDRIFGVMLQAPWHLFLVLTKRPERARRYLTAIGLEGRVFQYWMQAAIERFGSVDKASRGLKGASIRFPLPNLWLGTSVEDQEHADLRIPDLLASPAALHWLSVEPMLGPVDLSRWLFDPVRLDDMPGYAVNDAPGALYVKPSRKIGLVIAGGESQAGARPLAPDPVRSLRAQCHAAETVFHFKQWGAWLPRDQVTTDEQRELADKIDRRGLITGHYDFYEVGPTVSGHLLDGVEHRAMPPWPQVAA